MVRHICMWILKDDLGGKTKEEVSLEIRRRIEELVPKIDFIVDAEVGININPKEPYNVILNTVFKTLDDVKAYAIHPEHLKVVDYIKSVVEVRSAIDYEF